MSYAEFLQGKLHSALEHGVTPTYLPAFLFDFQRALVEWAIRKGRCAIFADCGLGKTPMQLVWAQNIVEATNRPVLILTPLAVAQQTLAEAEKFGIPARRPFAQSSDARIVVTNYEKLHQFRPADFAGVVCDESSAIKAFDGARRAAVTEFLRTIQYRLLCTATAAPNDYIELGTASEALGELGQMDMLGRFFRNDQNNSAMKAAYRSTGGGAPRWRFKGHAEQAFWRWVCSWARACRRPSDIGFADGPFILPPLVETEHVVETSTSIPGMLFSLPATNMREEREERRRTIGERCDRASQLVRDTGRPAVIWCHLNDEGTRLAELIPDGRQVSGADSDDAREQAYSAFARGRLRVLIIKPKLGAWGLNWQHCSHVISFASHSYEQYYQAVRRCWRFGQHHPVSVDIIATEGERRVKDNLRRKAQAADRMFTNLVRHMQNAMQLDPGAQYAHSLEAPPWL